MYSCILTPLTQQESDPFQCGQIECSLGGVQGDAWRENIIITSHTEEETRDVLTNKCRLGDSLSLVCVKAEHPPKTVTILFEYSDCCNSLSPQCKHFWKKSQ